MTKRGRMLLAMLVLGWCAAGCAMFGDDDTKLIHVQESQMNWLDVIYTSGAGQPATRLSLMGSGHLRIQQGTSPLVIDDFSREVKNKHWNDVHADQFNVTPEEVRNLFQAFVDRGVMRKPCQDFTGAAERGAPFARIVGTLDNTAIARDVVEPELLCVIQDLIKTFEHPQP